MRDPLKVRLPVGGHRRVLGKVSYLESDSDEGVEVCWREDFARDFVG